MKKLTISLFALCLLAAPHAQAQSVGGGAQEVVQAWASWTIRYTDHRAVFRFVDAYRSTDVAGPTNSFAALGKTRCRLDMQGRNTYLSTCTVTTRIIFFKPQYFAFDPFLRGASLLLKDGNRTHHIKWKPKNARPSPDYDLEGGERSLVFYGLLRSRADARGRVLGERFTTDGRGGHAVLSRGYEAVLLWDTDEERSQRTFVHRSDTRAEAQRWIRSLPGGGITRGE